MLNLAQKKATSGKLNVMFSIHTFGHITSDRFSQNEISSFGNHLILFVEKCVIY